jgi:hypothetical protein
MLGAQEQNADLAVRVCASFQIAVDCCGTAEAVPFQSPIE